MISVARPSLSIVEAMLALTLMDHYLRHRAQNADVQSAVPVVGRQHQSK